MAKTSQANGVILGSGEQEVSRVTLQAIAIEITVEPYKKILPIILRGLSQLCCGEKINGSPT